MTLNRKNRIIKFDNVGNQGINSPYINGGIYIINKKINFFNYSRSFSLEKYLAEQCDKINIYGRKYDTIFFDIGIPDDYHKFNYYLKE